ncbi:sugar phosphate isomerase/epimerase family protein [Acetonema longum]|uniref:Xylose isomerase n=1 Tax=Acetonema longum DSM 6540 TaxID=1009370 RepID=F7NGK7_9FIRM|nr:sugar phosphate isomerase/epimerase family protein [Acetonema longum]EGO64811.1 xylose isomerase [Acetonema longum DSM 6540]
MKLAYTVATPDTRKKALAYSGDFSEICAKLKDIGYTGLELFVRDPCELDKNAVVKAIESHNLEIPVIGTGPAVSEDKLTFTAADEQMRAAAIRRAKEMIDFASLFNAQVNIGKLRGDIRPDSAEQSRKQMKHAFQEVCSYAQTKKINVTIEPQNRFVINNLNTTQQALDWLHELQISNLFLMLDTFHMNIEDQSMAASILKAKDHNIHFHFAENNRGIPGTGHINFPELIRILRAIHYDGYISLEIDQLPDSYTAAQGAFAYLNTLRKED